MSTPLADRLKTLTEEEKARKPAFATLKCENILSGFLDVYRTSLGASKPGSGQLTSDLVLMASATFEEINQDHKFWLDTYELRIGAEWKEGREVESRLDSCILGMAKLRKQLAKEEKAARG